MKQQYNIPHLFILSIILLSSIPTYAQKGIGTDTPSRAAVVEIRSSNRGILIPRVALESTHQFTLNNPGNIAEDYEKTNSLLVYNTATKNDVTPGFYYWVVTGTNGEDSHWEALGGAHEKSTGENPKYFYMPPVVMPTDESLVSELNQRFNNSITFSNGVYTIDLYKIYRDQFTLSDAGNNNPSSFSSEGSSHELPILTASELIYNVTYYDNTVFDIQSLSTEGKLKYEIKPDAEVGIATFMNIVFERKEE